MKKAGTAKATKKKGQKEQRGQRAQKRQMITKQMRVSEILALLPESESLLAQYGLSCFHCSANAFETLQEGCVSHGFADEDIDDLVTDLSELLKDRPVRPEILTVTLPAAKALLKIAVSEKKKGQGLIVGVDEGGGFCMEFTSASPKDMKMFFHKDAPEMKLFATALTLQRIGGATIDFREGRFKLDLGEAAHSCNCSRGTCHCL